MEREDVTERLPAYPTPKACGVAFIVSLILVVFIGSILQYVAFLPGLYVTEWLLILGPPLVLLWRKKVDFKKALTLQQPKSSHILFGVVSGIGIYFVMLGLFYVFEGILGPYPTVEFLEKAFPTTWLNFIPWVLAMGVSAGICEEALFRGFIQNGLQNYWGPVKAVVITAVLFGLFHLDPWRTPSAILLGLLAGYLLVRTRSLYAPIVLHATSNTLGQVLAFTDNLPQTNDQWVMALSMSAVLIIAVLVIAERTKKESNPSTG